MNGQSWLSGVGGLILLTAPLIYRPSPSICSVISFPTERRSDEVYVLATAKPDTVPVVAGSVSPRTGEGHSGWTQGRSPYGQVLTVERVGRPWEAQLPRAMREVVLVPWDYGPGCEPVYWTRSAQWVPPGTHGVFRAKLRDREYWAGDRPTFDVSAPEYTPYPSARGLRRPPSFAASERDAYKRELTAVEFLEFVEAMPLEDSLTSDPDSAVSAVQSWARRNAELARAWPAFELLRQIDFAADYARLRLITSPVAGTFRVTVSFGSGDSTVLYARTELHPMSPVTRRGPDHGPSRPFVGYYLMCQYAATLRDLPKDYQGRHTSYHAVSLKPVLVTEDSSVWRGEVDPLVEVTFLDPRESVRSHAESLFGASEEARDPSWYFLPGIWVTYPNGRVRYEWTVRRGSQLLYAVRAERTSNETTIVRSR